MMNNTNHINRDHFAIGGLEDDLINSDLESFSLSPKSRSETRQTRRNAESTIELPNDIMASDNPLTHIFGDGSNEMTRVDGRRRRGSLFEDDQTDDFRSSRIFSVKASVNRPRELESDENETIPFIPDIDELDDPISKGPQDFVDNFVVNKLISLQELEKDIIKHQAFSNLCGVDSSILSSRLVSQGQVKEDDVPWTWDSLISEVASYIERKDDE
uniref:Intraflagellar transport protein 43 homolog n=2 Tax=Tetranychus urticae TaxID=32264 RepID=T1K930_TETUR